ncbi:unnamed protein product [Lymnaea stagnalis]|uniref:RING-type domain-containing protein n=1 Tax=Lymnaea stagnalis TaxID=6523 RepID=A0AAV2IBL6_LYMST
MWLKLCLLLIYISLLFILSRVLDAISWCESGYGGAFSHQLLDPMVLSVAKLKALLEQRGVSYESVVEKSELTSLVDSSGTVSTEEAEMAQEESATATETNFTSGAHFIEQVEDAKDSVWLVQIVSHSGHHRVLSDARWKTIRHKASKFGVRTGLLDCSLDFRYCYQKGWHSPFLLLALPSQYEKKASVAMYDYSGSVKETAVLRWVREKLDEKVLQIKDPTVFKQQWKDFSDNSLEPEIRAVLFTESSSAPLFYSALSVKFPGRVKFGVVCLKSSEIEKSLWHDVLKEEKITELPAYVIYSTEKSYTYGNQQGEQYSFISMERFLKFLYPCLNDIFIISFFVANVMSWFELAICNCQALKRLRKLIWCIFKYNIVVIMLWLPIIGIFQMPYLDRVPLLALKLERIFCTSTLGTILRGDFTFFVNHPIYLYTSFLIYLVLVNILCKKYRQEEQEDDWFNFTQMQTLTHLRPNDFFEPMRIGGYDLMGGLEIFGSRLSQPSLWLQPLVSSEYIKYLPTWHYRPRMIADRVPENVKKIEQVLSAASGLKHAPVQCTCVIPVGRSEPSISRDPCCDIKSNTSQNMECVCVDHVSVQNNCVPSHVNTSDPWTCNNTTHKNSYPCDPHPEISIPNPQPNDQPAASLSQHQSCSHFSKILPSQSCSLHSNLGKSTFLDSSSFSERASTNNSTTSLGSDCNFMSPTQVKSASDSTDESSEISASSSTYGFPVGYMETHQCVICLDEFTPSAMLCGLPCGHVFHETCIIAWLNREKHFCPMCRWPSYKLQPPHPVASHS